MSSPGAAAITFEDESEKSLIARAVRGERDATRMLYERHVDRVHRIVYRICRDRDLALDLTQDVFVQVFRALGQFRGDAAFTTWLHRVTVTTSLNAMRTVTRLRKRETDLDGSMEIAAPVRDDIAPDLRDALAAAIDALPDPLRVALVMHTVEGYTHVEIGAALGIAEGTSKRRVFDARALLRQALSKHAGEQ